MSAQDIIDRIGKTVSAQGYTVWQRTLGIPTKWEPLVLELDEKLKALDPDYDLVQVKTKFGGLRYYASTKLADRETQRKFANLLSEAEEEAYRLEIDRPVGQW